MERIFWYLLCVTMIGCIRTSFTATGRTYEPWEVPIKIFQESPTDIKYEELG